MNIRNLNKENKPTQTSKIFSATEGQVISISITTGNQFKKHTTKVPAFLVCILGEAVFENEKGVIETLASGDYVNIEPNVVHWITANKDSNLLLIK
ncbi:MAG: hypothetical protein ABJH04_14655 [Cyclobacteriaceae bacterium]